MRVVHTAGSGVDDAGPYMGGVSSEFQIFHKNRSHVQTFEGVSAVMSSNSCFTSATAIPSENGGGGVLRDRVRLEIGRIDLRAFGVRFRGGEFI